MSYRAVLRGRLDFTANHGVHLCSILRGKTLSIRLSPSNCRPPHQPLPVVGETVPQAGRNTDLSAPSRIRERPHRPRTKCPLRGPAAELAAERHGTRFEPAIRRLLRFPLRSADV